MAIGDELRALKNIFIPWIYIFAGLAFFFFFFSIGRVNISGYELYLPLPYGKPIASEVFSMIRSDLVPPDVKLIVTEPTAAFVVQAGVAVAMALVITFPLLMWKALKYVLDALYRKEKKALIKVVFPAAALFVIGVVFGYRVILPPTFKVLYGYAGMAGAETFFTIQDFASFVLGFSIGCGVMFLLPVVMGILNALGVTSRDMWRNNWRYACWIFLIFSAIITPDGSGITMMLLSAPLTGLYFIGSVSGYRRDMSVAGSANGRKITNNNRRR